MSDIPDDHWSRMDSSELTYQALYDPWVHGPRVRIGQGIRRLPDRCRGLQDHDSAGHDEPRGDDAPVG